MGILILTFYFNFIQKLAFLVFVKSIPGLSPSLQLASSGILDLYVSPSSILTTPRSSPTSNVKGQARRGQVKFDHPSSSCRHARRVGIIRQWLVGRMPERTMSSRPGTIALLCVTLYAEEEVSGRNWQSGIYSVGAGNEDFRLLSIARRRSLHISGVECKAIRLSYPCRNRP